MATLSIRNIGQASLALLISSTLHAQTVTDPVGVVKVTIAAAPAAGQTKLTAISATLRNAIDYQGVATSVGTFNPDSAGTPPKPDQTITKTSAGWTTNQWTTEPHICYIENAAGAEEAYLIKSHTADTLTLATSFDFSTRYTSTPTFRICKANTLGSLFGTSSVPFQTASAGSNADNIYAWNGSSWKTYWHTGSSWESIATAFSGDENDAVIFPDEGLFVLRRETSPIEITFNGSVPTKPQITTIPGDGLTFVSSRYPVDTKLIDMGFQDLPNWLSAAASANADTVYVWNPTNNSWRTFWHDGSNWESIATAFSGNENDEIIKADSAVFVLRRSSSDASNSANSHTLPFNLDPSP